MTKDNKRNEKKGMAITFAAGTLWGFSGTCSQFLFKEYGITAVFLTNLRLVFAGIILISIALVKERENLIKLLKNKEDLIRLAIFGTFGILFNQLSYLKAISYTNSGTATVLQYIGPVIIMGVSCFLARSLPTFKEILAVILVVVGTWLIATHGSFGSLYITPKGLIWGLLSALAVVNYTMLPVKLIKKYGSIPVVGSGMLVGGTALSLYNRFQGGPKEVDSGFLFYFVIIILLGTVIPYTAYLYGVSLCGAVKGSLVSSVEPVSATVCMVVWLKEVLYPVDILGFLCVFITVFLLAKTEGAEEAAES